MWLDVIVLYALLLTQKLSYLLNGTRSTRKITILPRVVMIVLRSDFLQKMKEEWQYRTFGGLRGWLGMNWVPPALVLQKFSLRRSSIVVRGKERVQKSKEFEMCSDQRQG